MANKTPEVPAASLADIAFMLLIFFLVTTTMDVDQGLLRVLPEWVDPNESSEDIQVKERNLFVVMVSKDDQLLVENEYMDISNLREATKEFILNPNNSENLPQKKETNIKNLGVRQVSQGIISLKNDVGTHYKAYIEVQNELVAAVNEVRDQISMQEFGKKFEDLNDDQEKAIKDYIKAPISEAEPNK
ncbi:MAG: ExbD/TolR family protein [Bacteroidales bacterium]